jgi:Protein of unknown function (DUF3892)
VVEVTAVHMVGGEGHEHIGEVRWINPKNQETGQSTREAMVAFLRKAGNRAYVTEGQRKVEIGVVDADPPYIRTYADEVWTNNLLALPRY